jgi:RNA polymerase sigma-70 factor (ECF subfamily)
MFVKAVAERPRGSEEVVTDRVLVRRVLAGETSVFADIVRRYQRGVWRAIAQMGEDRPVTENLVQQTFLNAYEHLDQYDQDRDLSHWLMAIARNLVRKELRSQGRERHRMRHYRAYLAALYGDDDDRVEERHRRLESALEACRQGLGPGAAQAVQLRYQKGLDVEAIADLLGRSAAATRQLLFRARTALRACVQERLASE